MEEDIVLNEAAKAHTGEHILFRALSTVFEGIKVKKVELGKRNYFLVSYDKELEGERLLKAELLANTIIAQDLSVTTVVKPRDEVMKEYPKLRVRWDRISNENVTVVEVENFDWAACVGEHVQHTGVIEVIIITRVNSVGPHEYEIEFEVAQQAKSEAVKRAALARDITSELRTSMDQVIPTVHNLKERTHGLTESVRLLTLQVLSGLQPEYIEGIPVYCTEISGGDRKTIQRETARLTSENSCLIVLVEQLEDTFLVAGCSHSLSLDCTQLIHSLLPEGKGGGKPEQAIASSAQKVDISLVRERIRQFLKQSRQKAGN
jgi:alanyl-tRNA synthetase